MRHAYKSDASATAPPLSESNDAGFPTDGDPANNIPTTVFGTYWAHAVSSEIVEVIEHNGLTPDGGDLGQLAEAIDAQIDARFAMVAPPGGVTFASRNEHIQANPPGNEAANPRDAAFAIFSYEDEVTPDFATRNEHTRANPPGDEFANPLDARFAIFSYEDEVTPDFASRNEHTQANPPGNEFANPLDARFAINAYLEARA